MKSGIKKVYRYTINKLFRKNKIVVKNTFDLFYSTGKVSPSSYNRKILDGESANLWMVEKINSGLPFFASRFGDYELSLASNTLFNALLNKKFWSDKSIGMVARDSSWGGNIKAQERLFEVFLKDISLLDGLGVWYNHGEQIMANYICPNAVLFNLISLESFFYNNPWTLALENKKVLVIHPYTYSIPLQYNKRDLIFGKKVLPEFELQCYKPFTTYNNDWENYTDSKEALDKMIEDVSKLNFDIALVAAGPFGFSLSAAIKKMDKQAIHIGGALQLFFGIIGKRWEDPEMPQSKLINENWVRPDISEIPTDSRSLKFSDGGTYW